jgi:hypothetical protein
MVTPMEDQKVRPSAWWYGGVVVLWLASIGVFVWLIVIVANVIDDGVTPVGSDGTVVVKSDGLTLYSTFPFSHVDCMLRSADGQTVGLDDLPFDLSIDTNGRHLDGIGRTPDGLAAGTYAVTCPGPLRNEPLWYGDWLPVRSLVIGFVVSIGLGVAGLALLIVLLLTRHNSKSRIRQLRTPPPGFGGYGGIPPGYGWTPPPPPDPMTQPPYSAPPTPPGAPPANPPLPPPYTTP